MHGGATRPSAAGFGRSGSARSQRVLSDGYAAESLYREAIESGS